MTMWRVALLVLVLTAVCNGILPEIVDSGISHILEEQTEQDRMFVEVEQLPEEKQQETEVRSQAGLHLSASIFKSSNMN